MGSWNTTDEAIGQGHTFVFHMVPFVGILRSGDLMREEKKGIHGGIFQDCNIFCLLMTSFLGLHAVHDLMLGGL